VGGLATVWQQPVPRGHQQTDQQVDGVVDGQAGQVDRCRVVVNGAQTQPDQSRQHVACRSTVDQLHGHSVTDSKPSSEIVTRLPKVIWEQTASPPLVADAQSFNRICQVVTNVHAHLIHDFFCPLHSSVDSVVRSVQPFLHSRCRILPMRFIAPHNFPKICHFLIRTYGPICNTW